MKVKRGGSDGSSPCLKAGVSAVRDFDDIADFFVNNSVPVEFPTFNVWAKKIETDIEKLVDDKDLPDGVREFLNANTP